MAWHGMAWHGNFGPTRGLLRKLCPCKFRAILILRVKQKIKKVTKLPLTESSVHIIKHASSQPHAEARQPQAEAPQPPEWTDCHGVLPPAVPDHEPPVTSVAPAVSVASHHHTCRRGGIST